MNRLSYNVRALSIRDRNGLRAHLKALNPTAVVTLDDLTFAADVKQDIPGTISIHRAFGDSEAHFKDDPRQLARRYASDGYGRLGVYAYGPNEPAPNDKINWHGIINWLVAFAEECERVGVRAVLGNLGPGNIERSDIDSGLWDPYLRMLDRYHGWHLRGDHDYTALPPITGGGWGTSPDDLLDPARVQPDRWPKASAITDTTDNWHLMRGRWLNARAKKLGLKVPGIVLTECFFDRMPDLERRTPNVYKTLEDRYGAAGYKGFGTRPHIKGHNSWRDIFKAYWPQWDFETALYNVLAWCDRVYPSEYISFCQYMWCTGASDWDTAFGYDFAPLTTLQKKMEQHQGGQPPVSTPTVPKPTTAAAKGRVARVPQDFVNVREQPRASARDVGDLHAGDLVEYYPESPQADAAYGPWVYVYRPLSGRPNVEGWVALQKGGVVIERDFGPPRTLLPVPFVDQYGDDAAGPNSCGPASGAMAVNYARAISGSDEPITALAFSTAMGRTPGAPSTLTQLRDTLHDDYGITADLRHPSKGNAPTVAEMRQHLQATGVVIVLLERGQVPGALAYHPFARAHIAPLVGEGDGFFVLADPLAIDARGQQLVVSDADLTAAMRSSTWQNADGTTGTNAGPQALFVEAPKAGPDAPAIPPDLYAAILAQSARLEAAHNALIVAQQEYALTVAEVLESLKSSIGYQP